MNLHDFAPWLAPIVTGLVLFVFGKALPVLVGAAIDGKFSEFRNEEVGRMSTHNDNENAHPRLRILTEFEERIEKAFEELREGQRTLSTQIEELKEQISTAASTVTRKKGRKVK